ncbi:hypothetical protein MMC22_004971 [Lobaria immixta]|nr:hypothetical protein [Lobaria immixta]
MNDVSGMDVSGDFGHNPLTINHHPIPEPPRKARSLIESEMADFPRLKADVAKNVAMNATGPGILSTFTLALALFALASRQ